MIKKILDFSIKSENSVCCCWHRIYAFLPNIDLSIWKARLFRTEFSMCIVWIVLSEIHILMNEQILNHLHKFIDSKLTKWFSILTMIQWPCLNLNALIFAFLKFYAPFRFKSSHSKRSAIICNSQSYLYHICVWFNWKCNCHTNKHRKQHLCVCEKPICAHHFNCNCNRNPNRIWTLQFGIVNRKSEQQFERRISI